MTEPTYVLTRWRAVAHSPPAHRDSKVQTSPDETYAPLLQVLDWMSCHKKKQREDFDEDERAP
jgi:hypothetical protein